MATDQSFFEHERARLAEDISKSFEALLDSTNSLNRRLEEVTVPSIRKEFRSVADLWMSFQNLMQSSTPNPNLTPSSLPGTGGYRSGQEPPSS